MDTKIDWLALNEWSFQRLCNSILLHEVSKKVEVFDKTGKDGGYDARFIGTYGGTKGKWRFQAKFHVDKTKKPYDLLLQDIKLDLKKHLKDEDCIVYMSNLDLLPQHTERLLVIANDIIQISSKKVEVLIWHGSHLQTLLNHHPVIVKGFWHNRGVMFQSIEEHFEHELKQDQTRPFNFSNPFLGRKAELVSLWNFIKSEEVVCYVIAPGGYGKTRLCIDFLQKISQLLPDWHSFALMRSAFDAKDFDYCLSGKDKLIVLIDDAHMEENLQGIVEMAKKTEHQGKVKLLLTTRSSLKERIQSEQRTHERFGREILVEQLSEKDSLKMVMPHAEVYSKRMREQRILFTGDFFPDTIAKKIVRASNGIPLVLNTHIYSLTHFDDTKAAFSDKELGFLRIVWDYLKEEIGLASQNVNVQERDIKAALQLMALSSPFYPDDFDQLQANLNLSEGEFKSVLELFVQGGVLTKQDLNAYQRQAMEELQRRNRDHPQFADFFQIPPERFEFTLIPDPYKDIIVSDYLKETKQLKAWVAGAIGQHFNSRWYKNIFLGIEAIPALQKEGVEILNEFVREIARPFASPAIVLRILKDASWAGYKFKELGLFAFTTTLSVLETDLDKSVKLWKEVEDGKTWKEIHKILKEIFLKQIAGMELNEGSYQLLVRYCRVVNNWDLYESCSASDFGFPVWDNFHNLNFLIGKAKQAIEWGMENANFSLNFLGWLLGIGKSKEFGEDRFGSGLRYHFFQREDNPIPTHRQELLQFLNGLAQSQPSYLPIIFQMFIHLMRHSEFLWVSYEPSEDSEYQLKERQTAREFAVVEMKIVYPFLIETAKQQCKDFKFRYNLWHSLWWFRWQTYFPELHDDYQQLLTVAEQCGHIGVAIALDVLKEPYLHYDAVNVLIETKVQSINSTSEAALAIQAYFDSLERIGMQQVISPWFTTTYIHWKMAEIAKVNSVELYEELLQHHPHLVWRSRGEILHYIGFGTKPDRDYFFQKIDQLLAMQTAAATTEVLDSYYSAPKIYEFYLQLDNRDQRVLEQVRHQLENAQFIVELGKHYSYCQAIYLEVLAYFVRLDPHWAEGMVSPWIPSLDEGNRTNLLISLWRQEKHAPGSVPYLAEICLSIGWSIRFMEDRFLLNEVITHALSKQRFEQVLSFFQKHLRFRHQVNSSPLDIYRPLLPPDPLDGNARKLDFNREDQYTYFGQVLEWYLSLDFATDPYFIDDAWQLLKYFQPQDWKAQPIKEILLEEYQKKQPTPTGQVHFFTVLFIFYDDLDLINEALQATSMPSPTLEETKDLSVGYGNSKETAHMRHLANYWITNCPYTSERIKQFLVDLRKEKHLWM